MRYSLSTRGHNRVHTSSEPVPLFTSNVDITFHVQTSKGCITSFYCIMKNNTKVTPCVTYKQGQQYTWLGLRISSSFEGRGLKSAWFFAYNEIQA